jgi:hypothetical protein
MLLADLFPQRGLADVQLFRRRAAGTLTRMAEEGARSRDVINFVGPWLAYLYSRPLSERLEWAWRNLPTQYVAALDGDQWQSAWLTLRRGEGDCEDWAVLLAAILLALGVTARVGVMPGHAAVFVPLVDRTWPWTFADPSAVPASWRIAQHLRRKWLVLEATTSPKRRGMPGTDDELIRPWLGSPHLWIGEA